MTVLTRTWVFLMGLTAVSLLAGRPGGEGSIGLLGIGLVLMAANFKADQILTHFLGLQRANPGINTINHQMPPHGCYVLGARSFQ